jgi:diguanylate cyclase
MAKHGVAVAPKNYAVWFEYVSGTNPALNSAIDELIAAGAQFSEEVSEDLFDRYVAECNVEHLLNVRAQISSIIKEVGNSMLDVGADAEHYGVSLNDLATNLTQFEEISELRSMLRSIVDETRQMQQTALTMQESFQQRSDEIAELQKELERERRKANTDPLTGLANRLTFYEAMDSALEEMDNDLPPCLLMVDIDAFKTINDSHGHLVGDRVIRFVAEILRKQTKGKDTAARLGGDEFAVLLPETPMEGALALAENVLRIVADARLVRSDNKRPIGQITLSLGVARYHAGEDQETFMDRADRALYAAKKGGRNRVIAESEVDEPLAFGSGS